MKVKYGICIASLCLFSYLKISMFQEKDISSLYNGALFNGRPIEYALLFFLFANYCFFIFHEFETYIFQSGIYLVVREQSRNKLAIRLCKKLFFYILQFEGIKLACYVIMMSLINKAVILTNPLDTLKTILLQCMVYFIILLFQVLLELILSSKIALIIILSLYIISIGISDYTYSILTNAKSFLCLMILPNIGMKLRLDAIKLSNDFNYILVGYLLVIIVFTYVILRKVISKLDLY